jgi:hypothetical protein
MSALASSEQLRIAVVIKRILKATGKRPIADCLHFAAVKIHF